MRLRVEASEPELSHSSHEGSPCTTSNTTPLIQCSTRTLAVPRRWSTESVTAPSFVQALHDDSSKTGLFVSHVVQSGRNSSLYERTIGGSRRSDSTCSKCMQSTTSVGHHRVGVSLWRKRRCLRRRLLGRERISDGRCR